MPRGGSRPGAGRKPKGSKVVGMDGKPRADVLPPSMQTAVVPAPDSPLIEPPADLSDARKAIWRTWAPHALAEGTLTEATASGFREFTERMAVKNRLWAQVEEGAPGWGDAFKLWEKASKLVNVSMKEFKLTAFGKPAAPAKPKASANPFAAFAPAVKR